MKLPGYAVVTGAGRLLLLPSAFTRQLANYCYLGSGLGRGIALAFAASGSAGVLFVDIDGEAAARVATSSKKVSTDPDYRAIAM